MANRGSGFDISLAAETLACRHDRPADPRQLVGQRHGGQLLGLPGAQRVDPVVITGTPYQLDYVITGTPYQLNNYRTDQRDRIRKPGSRTKKAEWR